MLLDGGPRNAELPRDLTLRLSLEPAEIEDIPARQRHILDDAPNARRLLSGNETALGGRMLAPCQSMS